MDVEYISLHGCIRNTPSDTEHKLRAGRSPGAQESNIWTHAKLKKMEGKRGECVGQDLHPRVGETEAGVRSPHRAIVWDKGETFEVVGECSS